MSGVISAARETGTLSERLAEYVCGLRFEDIPREAIEHTKDHLVHHIGLAFGGYITEVGGQARRIARQLGRGVGECSVIGEAWKAPALEAAFANCSMMRELRQDDVLFPAGVHPGLMTMPVALALGEQERSPGREILTAIVLGYDLLGKLGNVVWAWDGDTPRRPTIPFGPFGAAAVAARLLGLTREQATHAIGYAAHSAMGLAEGDLTSHYYSLVCRNGIMGAIAAREGGVTALTVLEGRYGFYRSFFREIPAGVEASFASLGREFEILNATTKRYPGTALNIVPVQLVLAMRAEHGLRPENVARCTLRLSALRENFAAGHSAGPFASDTQAQSSLPFSAAIALLDGRIEQARYAQFADPHIMALVGRIEVILEPGWKLRASRIEITTTDGRRYAREGEDYTFARRGWLEWVQAHGQRLLPDHKLVRLIDLISDLESVENVSELTACLRPR